MLACYRCSIILKYHAVKSQLIASQDLDGWNLLLDVPFSLINPASEVETSMHAGAASLLKVFHTKQIFNFQKNPIPRFACEFSSRSDLFGFFFSFFN